MKTRVATSLLGLVLVAAGPTIAVDYPLKPTRLLIKNPAAGPTRNKMVLTARGGTVTPAGPTEDPRCPPQGTGAASLTVASTATGESFTVDLGGANCANWTYRSSVDPFGRYSYRDPSGITCSSIVVVGAQRLKAVCRGPQVAYDLGADQEKITAVLSLGTSPRRYCTVFTSASPQECLVPKDGSDGARYTARRCKFVMEPCPASPSGAFVEQPPPF